MSGSGLSYVDPTSTPTFQPQVAEVGTTSAPLKSAAFFIGAYCKDYNGKLQDWPQIMLSWLVLSSPLVAKMTSCYARRRAGSQSIALKKADVLPDALLTCKGNT
jgi:hypothetical protein